MTGTGVLSQWEHTCMSKVVIWAVPAAWCTSPVVLWIRPEREVWEGTGNDMCLETEYPGSLANLTQGWGSHSENKNTLQKCLHGGCRVRVLKAEVNQPMIFNGIQYISNNLIKKKKVKNKPKTSQKTKNKTREKSEIYFLGYSLQLLTHCNLRFFRSHLGCRNISQQAPLSSQLQKKLKYDKRIRALNGSILHHPQPLSVVFPGQMKLECTYSCSEL